MYGYADVATKEPLQADAIFRWASMTKYVGLPELVAASLQPLTDSPPSRPGP